MTVTEREIYQRCLNNKTRVAARALGRMFDGTFRQLGLKGSQFSVLLGLSLANGATVGGLAEALGMDRTTLTRNLRPLERRGLVDLGAEGGKRARRLSLTPEGRELLERARPLWAEVDQALNRQLGDETVSSLITGLDTLGRVG